MLPPPICSCCLVSQVFGSEPCACQETWTPFCYQSLDARNEVIVARPLPEKVVALKVREWASAWDGRVREDG